MLTLRTLPKDQLALGVVPPPFGRGAGPHLTQYRLDRALPPYQPFGHNRHGLKIEGLCPFSGAALSP